MRVVMRAGLGAGVAAILVAGCGSEPTGPPQPEVPDPVDRVEITIDTDAARAPISPYIYGTNQDYVEGIGWTVRRHGGNRITGYNWENNFSHAGSDWNHSSDRFSIEYAGLSPAEEAIPGRVLTRFHERSRAIGAETIMSLQMAGYVAADANGTVTVQETAPSPRWERVEFRKNAPFTLTPDRTDGVVYMDELVNLLVEQFGSASTPRSIRWYSLDNEPGLWAHTHSRIRPDPVGAAELVDLSVDLASAVKDVDPAAEILGPALYGFGAFLTLQDAPDWDGVRGGHEWYIDYYLERMRQAEQQRGRRLLDVLDVHWYSEARGDNRVTDEGANTPRDVQARLQAPRTLWDASYREDSWIAQWFSGFLPILPRLRQSIDRHYPGTRLAVTEYNYGGGTTVSGGLAQADVLGAYGREGVDIANIWGMRREDTYQASAFKLYLDYDARGGSFGNTSVSAASSDRALASVYASIRDQDPSVLHVILLNKHTEGAVEMSFRVRGSRQYTSGEVWGFGGSGAAITQRPAIPTITGNTFDYVVPALTAVHIVLR
jgi:hypothetical protein